MLVINVGEVGHHHRLAIHVSRRHGTLQRDLTFANRVRRCLDGHCLLTKNSISSGHQNMGPLGAGLVDRALRRAPRFREVGIDQRGCLHHVNARIVTHPAEEDGEGPPASATNQPA